MSQINAYVTFNGNCHEAMAFYQEALGGELTLLSVQGMPVEARCPAGQEKQIMHAMLVKDDMVLMGTDMIGPAGYKLGNTIALSINCASREEIDTYYANLLQGGYPIKELAKQAWGALFGVVVDKYGLAWMLNYELKGDA